jgi:Fe-Mn family superoxide dismutase
MSACSLPDLPYGYGTLEPYLDARVMKLHYAQHHRYVDQVIAALRTSVTASSEGEQSIEDLLRNIGKVSRSPAMRYVTTAVGT